MDATQESIFGSCVPPEMSLTISAPASIAALATIEFLVSIDIGISDSARCKTHDSFNIFS